MENTIISHLSIFIYHVHAIPFCKLFVRPRDSKWHWKQWHCLQSAQATGVRSVPLPTMNGMNSTSFPPFLPSLPFLNVVVSQKEKKSSKFAPFAPHLGSIEVLQDGKSSSPRSRLRCGTSCHLSRLQSGLWLFSHFSQLFRNGDAAILAPATGDPKAPRPVAIESPWIPSKSRNRGRNLC